MHGLSKLTPIPSSYVVDYLIIIILGVVFLALDAVQPFHQPFSLTNISLQYPYATREHVPNAALVIIAIVAPAIVIAVYSLLIDGFYSHHQTPGAGRGGWWRARYTLRERLWELNAGILGLLLASGTAYVITTALKNAVGRPRPDFIARCQPLDNATDPHFGLSNSTICTQTDDKIMKNAFRSFPSGHSSSSWGGLFYLSLYLAGKLHLLDNRGEVWKVFVVLVPTAGAALVAASRIEDARHHPFDVLFGSALGALCAFVSYRQYFPSLRDTWRKGRAYPIRSWGTGPLEPQDGVAEREFARDSGKSGPRIAPLPHTEWSSHDTEAQAESAAGSGFHGQVGSTERLRQQEFPGAPRFDGPPVDRVQRLRSHSRHDSDLHLGREFGARGEYVDRSSSESYEMQARRPLPAQHSNQSSPDLHAQLQQGPYAVPERRISHPQG